jgi:hypothetical protein
MPTIARTPSDHYQEALRLLGVAGNAAGESDPALQRLRDTAIAEAGVHATLALAGRRARKTAELAVTPDKSGSPRHRWLYGTDEDGQS